MNLSRKETAGTARSRGRGKRALLATLPVILAMHPAAFAECPIPEDGTLFVRVDGGALVVDTSGTDTVTVEVSISANAGIAIEELCFDDHVEISGTLPERVYAPLDWRIRVPRTINLDLLTFKGSIRIASTDGNVTARTPGGSVIAGDIGGNAAMITQGGSIVVGNIDGNAELRSTGGGQIEIGDIGGNAELETGAGPITAGTVTGRVRAETAGGTIRITESQGQLEAVTHAGDILIGTSGLTHARTDGGQHCRRYRPGTLCRFNGIGRHPDRARRIVHRSNCRRRRYFGPPGPKLFEWGPAHQPDYQFREHPTGNTRGSSRRH